MTMNCLGLWIPMVNSCSMISLTLLTSTKVTVTKILHSAGVETWITSDGRAYFVRLQERHSENASGIGEGEISRVGLPIPLLPLQLDIFYVRVQHQPELAEHPGHRLKVLARNRSITGKAHVSTTSRCRVGCKSSAASMMALGCHQLTLNLVGRWP
jgi:hypothetical protein